MTDKTGISVVMERYIRSFMDGEIPPDFYAEVMKQAERPLLKVALEKTGGCQIKAAALLGINRNTMNKKVRQYRLKDKK
ncbi:MAG: hypothetical protein J6U64_04280 [Alphaproteobacteria bacterium]|jgi:two-component system nitrogen regulation response regulator GlnG|nr:hypothetical protein [Alphaproteobacteria bacterium]